MRILYQIHWTKKYFNLAGMLEMNFTKNKDSIYNYKKKNSVTGHGYCFCLNT